MLNNNKYIPFSDNDDDDADDDDNDSLYGSKANKLILKTQAKHVAGLTEQRWSFTNSSHSSEALIETNDDDHDDTLANSDVIYLDGRSTSQRKPQWYKEPYQGSEGDAAAVAAYAKAMNKTVAFYDSYMNQVAEGTHTVVDVCWKSMCCGGSYVSGTENCRRLPPCFVKSQKSPNKDNNLARAFCFCGKKFEDVNIALFFDLCELAYKHKLHLKEFATGVLWETLATQWNKRFFDFFAPTKGRALQLQFSAHLTWYQKQKWDIKAQCMYNKLMDTMLFEQTDEAAKEDYKKEQTKLEKEKKLKAKLIPAQKREVNEEKKRQRQEDANVIADQEKKRKKLVLGLHNLNSESLLIVLNSILVLIETNTHRTKIIIG